MGNKFKDKEEAFDNIRKLNALDQVRKRKSVKREVIEVDGEFEVTESEIDG